MRRFTRTPYSTNLQLMERTVRVETNNQAVLKLPRSFFTDISTDIPEDRISSGASFLNRTQARNSTAVNLSAFSTHGVRFLNVGQRGFLAVDVEQRKATGYLAESFFEADARLRHRPPLDVLLCMTAASLRLTALSGGCIGIEDRAAMIFGPPNSGKTTSSYLAAKMGMKFHADQVVFLDMEKGGLEPGATRFPPCSALRRCDSCRSWGMPPISRHIPIFLLLLDKTTLQARWAEPILPMYNIFLDRRAGCESELREVTPQETFSRLRESVLFEEDPRFDSQILASISALSEKPSFTLRYDSDPMIAANIINRMLR